MVMAQSDVLPMRQGTIKRLCIVIGLTYLAIMLISANLVLDPMIRHDDFPALLADPSGFYIKTLTEGRWLNYWWHLRGVVTPSWLNYALYQFFWVTFAGASALNAFSRNSPLSYMVALSIMIAVTSQALLISLWFNTLIPGLGLVALFAVLANYLSHKTMQYLLLLFVPFTLMAYTTYPFILLAICLTTATRQRSIRDLSTLVIMFVISFTLGIMLIYGLNYFEHGIFGMKMAEWREPTPAKSLSDAVANLGMVKTFALEAVMIGAYSNPIVAWAHGIIFTIVLIVSAKFRPWFTMYIITGLSVGLGLLCLQIILNGVSVPPRAVGFAWFLYSILCVNAALISLKRGGIYASLPWSLMLVLNIVNLMWAFETYQKYTVWQSATKQLAIKAGSQSGQIFVFGQYTTIPGADDAGIQGSRGLQLRLKYLTGREVFICDETPEKCDGISVGNHTENAMLSTSIQQLSGNTIIQLPMAAK